MTWFRRLLPKPVPPCPACGGELQLARVRLQTAARWQHHYYGCTACETFFHTEDGALVQSGSFRLSPLLPDLKARLDRLVVTPNPDDDGEYTPEHLRAFDEATRAFLAAGPDLLDQATEHLWAYYRDTAGEYDPADWEGYGIPALGPAADIWTEVTITNPPALTPGGTPLEPGQVYISFEGEVSWEAEHGLQLVFEDGLAVCKVGPYDGHVTNAQAYGDPSLLGTIYK